MIHLFYSSVLLAVLISCGGSSSEDSGLDNLVETVEEEWSQKPYLLKSSSPEIIDLTDTIAVKMNLNGYWVNKNKLNSNNILKLRFDSLSTMSWWENIKFDRESLETGEVPMETCQSFVHVMLHNDSSYLYHVGLARNDTSKIEFMSTNKFISDGETYLRHIGCDF